MNPRNLSVKDAITLKEFFERRTLFDEHIEKHRLPVCTCPSCGYPTLRDKGMFEVCSICYWEDDGQDDGDADVVRGGPNSKLSLTQSRILIGNALKELGKKIHKKLNLVPEDIFGRIELRSLKLEAYANVKLSDDMASDDAEVKRYDTLQQNSLEDLFV